MPIPPTSYAFASIFTVATRANRTAPSELAPSLARGEDYSVLRAMVVWWISIPPSHDRNWLSEVAVMPRAVIDGDRVRITGVRNFEYRSTYEFTVRYEEREVQLSHLTGLDFFRVVLERGPGWTYIS